MYPTTGFEWTGGDGGIGKHSGGGYQARPNAKKPISKLGYEDNDISVEVQRASALPVRPAATTSSRFAPTGCTGGRTIRRDVTRPAPSSAHVRRRWLALPIARWPPPLPRGLVGLRPSTAAARRPVLLLFLTLSYVDCGRCAVCVHWLSQRLTGWRPSSVIVSLSPGPEKHD